MSNKLKDLKLKKVGSEQKTDNDRLGYENNFLTEKKAAKIEKKKYKRRFYTGFAAVSILLIFVATLVVGAFVAWDIFAKEPTGLTLPQAIGLLSELYEDGSGIVTNPYDPEKDLDNFYVNLKKGLYLSEECEISVEDIVSGVLSSMINNSENGEEATDGEELALSSGGQLIMSDETAPEIGANGSVTGNKALDDLLASLDFDFSVLEGKEQETLEKELLELSDKELAAVLNAAFSSITEIDALKNIENEYGISIASVLSVKQVIIDEATVTEQKDVRITVTLSLNLRDAARTALANNKQAILSKIFKDGEVPSVVSTIADFMPSLLPKTIYVTASVFPNQQTWNAQVAVNNMEESKQADVNRLLEKFLTAKDDDGNEVSFMQSINQKIYDTIVQIDDLIPVNFTPSGNFETKPIQAVINMLGAENLTQGDFLALIRDIKLPTEESLGVDGYTVEAQELAATQFINGEFSEKYYFDNLNEETSEYFITASNLFSKINSFAEDEETLQRIRIRDDIKAGLDYEDGGAFRPFADEDTLAALLNGYLKNQAYKIENMEPWIMDVVCTAKGNDSEKGDYYSLLITIELDLTQNIDAQLKDNELMKGLVKQLLPDSVYVFLTYTQYEGNAETPSVSFVDINKKGNELSRQHFETLMTLLQAVQKKNAANGGSDADGDQQVDQITGMTFDQLEEQLNEKIYQAFLDIENNLGAKIEFVPSEGSSQGGAILPNIFEVLAANEKLKYDPEVDGYDPETDTGYKSEEEFYAENKISGAEMYLMLSQLYKYKPEEDDRGVVTNVDESVGITDFVSQIDAKYYIDTDGDIDQDGVKDDWSASNIENMLKFVSQNYQTVIRMEGENGGKSGLLDDETEYGDLNPYLSQYEFANIMNKSGKLNNLMQIMPEGEVQYILIYFDGTTPKIRMRINGAISFDASGADAEAIQQNKKYETLFPQVVNIIVDISVLQDETDGSEIYDASVDVNDIGDENIDKMLFFVKRFSGQSTIGEGEEQKNFTKEGLEFTIENKIKAAFNDMKADGTVETKFVDNPEGGLEFSTVFEVAVNNIYNEAADEDNKPQGNDMRLTIRELHAGLDNYMLANTGYDASSLVNDSQGGDDSTFTITPVSDTEINIDAQFLDAYMSTKMTGEQFTGVIGGSADDITFYQSYILPKTDYYDGGTTIETERTDAVKNYFNAKGSARIKGELSYLLVTLRVSTANLFDADDSLGTSSNLIPDEIYINALIALLEDPLAESKAHTEIFVNRMTDEQCSIMNRLLNSAGYTKTLFGDDGSNSELVDNIFQTKLVDHDYEYTIYDSDIGDYVTDYYPVEITVEDVVDSSRVWFCSLYEGYDLGQKDTRKAYIKAELSYNDGTGISDKTFNGTGDARRYGIAYLRYSETVDIL